MALSSSTLSLGNARGLFLHTEGLSVRISGNQGISGKGVLVLSHCRPLRASRCFTIRYLYATRGHQTPGSLALQPQRAFAKLIQESSPKQFPGFRGAPLCSSSRVQAGGERDASIPFRLAPLPVRAAPGPATSAHFYTHTTWFGSVKQLQRPLLFPVIRPLAGQGSNVSPGAQPFPLPVL